MIHIINKNWLPFICAILLGVVLAGCSKTEYEQIKRPYNNIERFVVKGYGDLDSISATIKDDTIIVYWNAESTPPLSIAPVIDISQAATISPASDQSVPFAATTVYTVTAEDGTAKEYILKPVFNVAVPRLTNIVAPNRWVWEGNFDLLVNGQYFFSNGDVSDIKVYAQRLRDGYEFDLTVKPETTGTQLNLRLPELTAELDSGVHRIWVQVGDFPSNYLDVWIKQPLPSIVITGVRLKEAGAPVYIGDTLTVVYSHTLANNELFNKYFNKDNIYLHNIGCFKTYTQYVNNAPIVSLNNAELKFVLSEDAFKEHIGSYINESYLYFSLQNNAAGAITQERNANGTASTGASLEIMQATIIKERP